MALEIDLERTLEVKDISEFYPEHTQPYSVEVSEWNSFEDLYRRTVPYNDKKQIHGICDTVLVMEDRKFQQTIFHNGMNTGISVYYSPKGHPMSMVVRNFLSDNQTTIEVRNI